MVDGLKRIPAVDVDLSEFFDGAQVKVAIRKYTPAARAQIREVSMRGVRIDHSKLEAGGAKPQISAVPIMEGSAERDMEKRRLKLQFGVVNHGFTNQGARVEWDRALWDEIDEANPAILDKVIDALDKLNGGEEEETPT